MMSSNLALRASCLDVHQQSFKIFGSEDKAELIAHFEGLSSTDRRSRFMYTMGENDLRQYIQKIDFIGTRVFGVYCLCSKQEKSVLAGVVHLTYEPANKVAEIALSVDASFRRLGLGMALMNQAIMYAKEAGYSQIKIECLFENRNMRALAVKAGFEIEIDDCYNCMGYLKC